MSKIPQGQPTTSRRCHAHTSNAGYPAFSIISHLHIVIVTGCIRREPLSQGSYMERCTGVDHLGAFFICKVCTCLLANEQEFPFVRSDGCSALLIRNISGFDIIRDTFVLKVDGSWLNYQHDKHHFPYFKKKILNLREFLLQLLMICFANII